jgi:hypothetical protein
MSMPPTDETGATKPLTTSRATATPIREKPYYVQTEGVEYPWNTETITVAEIRLLGGLPAEKPVIEVDPDNQERTLAAGEVIRLKRGIDTARRSATRAVSRNG